MFKSVLIIVTLLLVALFSVVAGVMAVDFFISNGIAVESITILLIVLPFSFACTMGSLTQIGIKAKSIAPIPKC